ncbi:hypothetical protein D3C76_1654530 [compost metagenome]
MPENTKNDPNKPGNNIHNRREPVTSARAVTPFLANSRPINNTRPTLELITSVISTVDTLSVMRTINRF